ncbi:hypothetical protein ACFQX6_28680 [Streptosporangium lutulentum]
MERNYTLDFLAGDRREKAILQHMVVSLFAGMLLGGLGVLLSYGPEPLYSVYNPYAYILFVVMVGRSAAGFGWALLAGALAAFGPLISSLAVSILHAEDRFGGLGGSGTIMNLMLATLVSFGVLSCLTRREDLWGDLAGGVLAGLVAVVGMNGAMPGRTDLLAFWPWNVTTVSVLVLGLVLTLRRGWGWVRSGAVALVIASADFLFAASF